MYKEYPKFTASETAKYGRKSRTDDPLLSVEEILERHDKILDEYSEKYLGGPIPEENVFREIKSSESIDDRPEMLKLLKFIESPKIKAILVVEVQRLCRGDLEDMGRLIKLLRYTNTYVITPQKIYDLRDEYDRDAFERELKRGNEYLEYVKKILNRGRLASVKEGNYIGQIPPYGFDRTTVKCGNKTCPTLKENKPEADVVRMIFDWYCNENIGPTAICRRLESLGIKTKTGNKTWKPNTIFNMLENVHYIGLVRWNWRKTVRIVEDSEIRKIRPLSRVGEYLIFDGKHEGIIPKELFDRAQQVKGERHHTPPDRTLKNPFSNILFCKTCGASMGYNTYRNKGVEFSPPKLRCNNQVHCKSGSVYFHEVKDYVINTLRDCIEDFKVRIKNSNDDSTKLHKNLIDRLQKQLKALEQKELEQWEAQYDPDLAMPKHIFEKLNKKLLAEKDEVIAALCKAEESAPNMVDYKEQLIKFTDALNKLEDPNVPAKITNEYLKDIIERMEYKRPPIVKITKENMHLYPEDVEKGLWYHFEPFEIRIDLKI